ncbi:unnamed protein product [Cyprideis torosa]|uniref:Uncharacterized protein n=1 Tax=Cyprideis torosa TaxID=163714 RepID=A0A7R8W5F4_9CRUS|nr:unnamed protein product [Cyprideis torosa]CAG0882830.1 unnamed protein product [Cyprideis torosa]
MVPPVLIIRGLGSVFPSEVVKKEISTEQHRLLKSLQFFTKPKKLDLSDIKKTLNIKEKQATFIQKCSKFLDLDEQQALELFSEYLTEEFEGSKATLKYLLDYDHREQELLQDIFFFWQHQILGLVSTLKHILAFSDQRWEHPYHDLYMWACGEWFTDSDEFLEAMLSQITCVIALMKSEPQRIGDSLGEGGCLRLLRILLRIQVELLAAMFLRLCLTFEQKGANLPSGKSEGNTTSKRFQKTVEAFQHHGWDARHPLHRYSSDKQCADLMEDIATLQNAVLLQMVHAGRTQEPLFVLSAAQEAVLSNLPLHPPNSMSLLVSLASNFQRTGKLNEILAQSLGRLNPIGQLTSILRKPSFEPSSPLGSHLHRLCFDVVHQLLCCFNEESIATPDQFWALVATLVRAEGASSLPVLQVIVEGVLRSLPASFCFCLNLLTAMVESDPDTKEMALCLLQDSPVSLVVLRNALLRCESLSVDEAIAVVTCVRAVLQNSDLSQLPKNIRKEFFSGLLLVYDKFLCYSDPCALMISQCLRGLSLPYAPGETSSFAWEVLGSPHSLDLPSTSQSGVPSTRLTRFISEAECTAGTYHVTEAFLELVLAAVERCPLAPTLLTSVFYVLEKIIPNFTTWHYTSSGVVFRIGHLSFRILEAVLDVSSGCADQCLQRFLNGMAEETMFSILSTPERSFTAALETQSNLEKGNGVDLIYLTRLALACLLKTLEKLSDRDPGHARQWVASQKRNLVLTVASHLGHRMDPRLPTLALKTLRLLAQISPMSILASLGSRADVICPLFLLRLSFVTEDIPLRKEALLFLATCVSAQPGLFDHLTREKQAGTGDALSISVQFLKSGTPKPLVLACLQLMQALWELPNQTALQRLRRKAGLWNDLVSSTIKCSSGPGFRVLALELHYLETGNPLAGISPKDSPNEEFLDCLKKFLEPEKGGLIVWSSKISRLLPSLIEEPSNRKRLADDEQLYLDWRALVMALVKKGTGTKREVPSQLKTELGKLVLTLLKEQTGANKYPALIASLAEVYLLMVNHWGSSGVLPSSQDLGFLLDSLSHSSCGPTFLLAKDRILSLTLQLQKSDPALPLPVDSIGSILHFCLMSLPNSGDDIVERPARLSLRIIGTMLNSSSASALTLVMTRKEVLQSCIQASSFCLKNEVHPALLRSLLDVLLRLSTVIPDELLTHHELESSVLLTPFPGRQKTTSVLPTDDDQWINSLTLATQLTSSLLQRFGSLFLSTAASFVSIHSDHALASDPASRSAFLQLLTRLHQKHYATWALHSPEALQTSVYQVSALTSSLIGIFSHSSSPSSTDVMPLPDALTFLMQCSPSLTSLFTSPDQIDWEALTPLCSPSLTEKTHHSSLYDRSPLWFSELGQNNEVLTPLTLGNLVAAATAAMRLLTKHSTIVPQSLQVSVLEGSLTLLLAQGAYFLVLGAKRTLGSPTQPSADDSSSREIQQLKRELNTEVNIVTSFEGFNMDQFTVFFVFGSLLVLHMASGSWVQNSVAGVCDYSKCSSIFSPVCGSDGRTYSNGSYLYMARRCSNPALYIVNRGPCGRNDAMSGNPCALANCGPHRMCIVKRDPCYRYPCPQPRACCVRRSFYGRF